MLTFVPANAQHIGARREQQDSFAFSDPSDHAFVVHGGLLGIVADGMGGLEGGSQASRTAVNVFMQSYCRKDADEAIPLALQRATADANAAVVDLSRQIGSENGTGTTLVAIVLHNASLYWIAVGDSRLYLLRRGELTRINHEHTHRTVLLSEVALGRIDRELAMADPQASHLTSYLGNGPIEAADAAVRAFPLMQGDFVIACTDGVYRAVTEEEIIRAFDNRAPGPGCEVIQSLTLSKGSAQQDNLTVIAVECKSGKVQPHMVPRVHGGSGALLMKSVLVLEIVVVLALSGLLVWRQQHGMVPGVRGGPASVNTDTGGLRKEKLPPPGSTGKSDLPSRPSSEKHKRFGPESAPDPNSRPNAGSATGGEKEGYAVETNDSGPAKPPADSKTGKGEPK